MKLDKDVDMQPSRGSDRRRPSQHSDAIFQLAGAVQQSFRQDPLLRLHADFAFERLEKIGVGGMGVVYRVFDHRTRREAALKVLLDSRADPGKIERFIREARVSALLDHPSIPPVYEFGRGPRGEYYILMKLIRGETLRDRLLAFPRIRDSRARREALQEILLALIRTGEALSFAHDRGVIHRDLKPDNIMLGEHGEVFLVDWGFARNLAESDDGDGPSSTATDGLAPSVFAAGLSEGGAAIGTVGYLAPEQAAGAEVDGRSDLFSLGAILYELLTGAAPIRGSGMAGMVAVLEARTVFPRSFGRGFPKGLAVLTRSCLARQPDRRPEDARAATLALRRIRLGLGLARKRRSNLLPLAAVLLAVGLGAGLWSVATKPGQAPSETANAVAGLLSRGSAASKAADHRAALGFFGAALALEEDQVDARRGRARARHRLKEYAAAASDWGLLIEAGQGDFESFLSRGRARVFLRQRQEAEADFDQAIKAQPKSREALLERGDLRQKRDNYRGALADYDRILKFLPGDARVHNKRGICLTKLRDYAQARTAFDQSIRLDAGSMPPHFNLGRLCRLQGNSLEAIAHYSRGIAIDDDHFGAHHNRAVCYSKLLQFKKAVAGYTRAIALKPSDSDSYSNRGRCYSKLKREDLAFADYNMAIALNPKAAYAFNNRANYHMRQGDLKKAVADFDRCLELTPMGQ